MGLQNRTNSELLGPDGSVRGPHDWCMHAYRERKKTGLDDMDSSGREGSVITNKINRKNMFKPFKSAYIGIISYGCRWSLCRQTKSPAPCLNHEKFCDAWLKFMSPTKQNRKNHDSKKGDRGNLFGDINFDDTRMK